MNDFFSSRNLKKIDITLFEPILLFSVFFLPGYISQGIQEAAPDMFESAYFNVFYLVSIVPQILLTLYIIVLKPGRSLADFDIGPIKKFDIPKSLLVFAGIYGCVIPIGLIASLIEPELTNQIVYGAGWQFTNRRIIPLVLLTCLTTGYAEEIFFRAYLFKLLSRAGAGLLPAVLITNLLFGSGHLYEGYYAFAATAAIGLFLSFIFIKTKSIHIISIAHGLYNFSVLMIAMTGDL